MKLTRILPASAIVLLAAACDTGGTKITAPDQARYDGGNYFGSGTRNSPVDSTAAGTDGLNTMGSGGFVDGTNTFGSGNRQLVQTDSTSVARGGNTMGSGNFTSQTPGTGMFGSGHYLDAAQSDTTQANTTSRGGNYFGSGN